MSETLADIISHGTGAWHAARAKRVSASEVGALFGADDWCDPYTLWARKTGRMPAQPDNARMRRGRALEPIILEEYALECGQPVRSWGEYLVDPVLPLLGATPDGERADGVLVEAKLTSQFWDEPPLKHQLQVQVQMACAGRERAVIVAMRGTDLQVWEYERRDDVIDRIRERVVAFWSHVERDVPPEPGAASLDAIKALYPRETGATINLPAEALEWDAELELCKREVGRVMDAKRAVEARIMAAIGDAARGELPNGVAYELRTVTRRVGAQPAREDSFRQLRRKNGGR